MKTYVLQFITFVKGFFCDENGKASSKRITAFIFVVLCCYIVMTIGHICKQAVRKEIEIKPETSALLMFLGGSVLITIISAIFGLFGIGAFTAAVTSYANKLPATNVGSGGQATIIQSQTNMPPAKEAEASPAAEIPK